MQQRSLIAPLFALSLVSTALLSACGTAEQGAQQQQQQAVEVGVVTLKTQPVPLRTELPGRTTAYRIAEVRPQVSGILLERHFEEGATVEAGQQLYQIDPATYDADVASGKAAVASAEASLKSTENTYKRYKNLLKDKAISQQEFDNAEATYLEAKAQQQVAQAQLKTAQINREFTEVNAPINGIIGRSNFTEGALVTASQAQPLAVIQQLDPIYVDINQSSKAFLRLKQEIEKGRVQANKNGNAEVDLRLEAGLRYSHKGELLFSEVGVNETTGTILLRARFPNPDGDLLPGMFVRAIVNEGTVPNGLLAPQQGIQRDVRGRPIALVVNGEGKVEQRQVETARAIGNQWLISSGLQDGDKLIVEGIQKVRPGAPVKAVEADLGNSQQGNGSPQQQ
ncbi:efflux RND transporter periplasmic adaptor subunit [Idiomarina xiamenensis]|uniref:Acriflavin resistance protein A n=1 Tax=Idiomarina xiamenensis 10-D-4 TaxID=740709 RepID=K2KQK0_9GAMM|nr:efflux RND transporter periplasmic adaptor subunit [Idiomarina xiamenensis]EKE84719.1 acriflavin resistance protein A [Idiomarina xiamenensis 10-D-4]